MALVDRRADRSRSPRTDWWHSIVHRHRDGSCTPASGSGGGGNAALRLDMPRQSIEVPTGATRSGSASKKRHNRYSKVGNTHHRHRLHTQHQSIRGHVPRVGQCIFLPQLPKKILGRGHVVMMHHKIALEEAMQRSRYPSRQSVSESWSRMVIQSTNHRMAIRSAMPSFGRT